MKIVVIGGSGLIGGKLVAKLREQGHDAVSADLRTGVNTLTGVGLTEVIAGSEVVVDTSNSPSYEPSAALEFFTTSTRNVLAAEAASGVGHHVALSIIGTDRLPDNGYFLAKVAQEDLIKTSHIPYTIVRATQFFEFVNRIADSFTEGGTVHVPPVLIQPMAADDVASALARAATSAPRNGMLEIAGPASLRFDEPIQRGLSASNDSREIVVDVHAHYFGSELEERSLLPGDDATRSETQFGDWLGRPSRAA